MLLQCFSHRYLGWKINVLDECNLPSKPATTRANHDQTSLIDHDDELESHSSIQVSVRVSPQEKGSSVNGRTLQTPNQGYINQDIISNSKLISPEISKHLDKQQSLVYKQPNSNLNSELIQSYTNKTDNIKHGRIATRNTFSLIDETRTFLPESKGQVKNPTKIIDNSNTFLYKHVYNISNGLKYNNPTNTMIQKTLGNYNVQNNALKISMSNGRLKRPVYRPVMAAVHKHIRSPNGQHYPMMLQHNIFSPSMSLDQTGKLRTIIVKKPVYKIPSNGMLHVPMQKTYLSQRAVSMPIRVPLNRPQIRESVSVSYSSSKDKPMVLQKVLYGGVEINKMDEHKKLITNIKNHGTVSQGPKGFNSHSPVLESGFKPLIQNSTKVEKRVFQIKDTGDRTNVKEENDDQTYVPLFMPSSLDHTNNHSKKTPEFDLSKKDIIFSRKLTSQNVNQKDVLDETPMAAERMDTYYLPPFNPIYQSSSSQNGQESVSANMDGDSQMIVTYDGKPVIGGHLIPPVSDLDKFGRSKNKGSSEDLVRNTPQFGPFRGDIPPPVPTNVHSDNIPQLKLSSDELPPHSLSLQLRPNPKSSPHGRTRLSQV